ncbi:MAG: neutral/alkaline non-lysosomal ceramidase N-terminal domain-containing protein [Oscillospiraceae bacterium]|nr:neutral/alkaline non-lysosomal ceramidase N-terminal domain-containing protein [Oscillospiraceae bacterium]
MKFGFFELDITPALGSIIPGDFAARYADEILDTLYVRAVAVNDGTNSLAIASIDACGITLDITTRIRERVSQMIPIKPEAIMVVATHAHGAGPTLNWGEEVVRDEHYLRMLTEKVSDAIVCAWKRAEDSEIAIGKENLYDISFIRVYKMKDGSFKTNPPRTEPEKIDKPCSEIDPELFVLSVKQKGEYVGAIINFATHPATIATTEITGDYISILSKEMKRLYGNDFVTVFINGACGNINHINPYDEASYIDPYATYKRVGTKLAEASSRAIANSSPIESEKIACSSSSVEVKFRKPSEEALLAAKALFDSFGDKLCESVPGSENYIDTFFALQTFLIQADKRTQLTLPLQLFQISDCFIFGCPCQIFTEFGKKIKESCDGYCFVSAFANDYCGYVPTAECMREGVYEARLAPTSALEPSAGNKITDKLIEMYKTMN